MHRFVTVTDLLSNRHAPLFHDRYLTEDFIKIMLLWICIQFSSKIRDIKESYAQFKCCKERFTISFSLDSTVCVKTMCVIQYAYLPVR